MSTFWKVVSLLTLVAVVVLTSAVVLAKQPVALAQSAQADTNATSTGITISAQGEVKATPDVAYINLGVTTTAPTAQEAMAQNSSALAAVIAKLESLGVAKKDMQTGYVSLNPQTTPVKPGETGSDKITSYWASNTLNVTVNDLTKVGQLLDAGITAGANTVNGIRFGVKDSSALNDQALTAAVKTARAKADVVAAGLGLKVTSVQSVSIDSYVGPEPVYNKMAAAGVRDSSVPIEAGELTITASVRVTFNF
jgi:uncharacterized protein